MSAGCCGGEKRVASAGLLVALGGAGVLNTILKFWFGRRRPDLPWSVVHEQGFSFPSGHAMTALVSYGMLAYLACRRCRGAVAATTAAAATAALILGIGVSRIYLGVHFPSDSMAGYAGGVLWLLTVIGGLAALPRLTPARDADREAACPRG